MMSPFVVIGLESTDGRSADTRVRNVGAAAAPDAGPAKTIFGLCVLSVMAKVPAVVTGEPVTVCRDGTVTATLVTVPAPPDVEPLRPTKGAWVAFVDDVGNVRALE